MKINYPYDDFLEDLKMINNTRDKQWVRSTYHEKPSDAVFIGEEKCFEANALRIIDFFAQKYPDPEIRDYRRHRITMACLFTADSFQKFLDANLAYQEDEEQPIIFGKALIDELYANFANSDHWLDTPDINVFLQSALKRAKSMEE